MGNKLKKKYNKMIANRTSDLSPVSNKNICKNQNDNITDEDYSVLFDGLCETPPIAAKNLYSNKDGRDYGCVATWSIDDMCIHDDDKIRLKELFEKKTGQPIFRINGLLDIKNNHCKLEMINNNGDTLYDLTPHYEQPWIKHVIETAYYRTFRRFYACMSYDEAVNLFMLCLSDMVENDGDTSIQNPMIRLSPEMKLDQNAMIQAITYDLLMSGKRDASCREILMNALKYSLSNKNPDNIPKEEYIEEVSKLLAKSLYSKTVAIYNEFPEIDPLKTKTDQDNKMQDFMHFSPNDIYKLIADSVVHQEEAKKAAAMLMYNHIRGRGRNIVMAGPTGCGKTEIWRTLSTVFPFIHIVNGPQLTPDGYKGGTKLSTEFSANGDADHMILVIDEADKIFEHTNNDFLQSLVIDELLKIMDNTPNSSITFRYDRENTSSEKKIDTSKISVVLCGSFEAMLKTKAANSSTMGFSEQPLGKSQFENTDYTEQDLIKYANVRAEIAGRVNQIVTLKGITKEDFKTIIDHPTASPVAKLEKQFGISIKINEKAKNKLAEKATESKLGCRVVKSTLLRCIDEQMFCEPQKDTYNLSNQIIQGK